MKKTLYIATIATIFACFVAFFVSCKNPVANPPTGNVSQTPENQTVQNGGKISDVIKPEIEKIPETEKTLVIEKNPVIELIPETEKTPEVSAKQEVQELPEVPLVSKPFSDNEKEFLGTLSKLSEEYRNVLHLSSYAMGKNIEKKNNLSFEIESLIDKINSHNIKYKRTEIFVPIEDLQMEYSSILYDINDNTGKTFEAELLENYSKYYNFYYQQAKNNDSFNIKDFEIGRDKHIEYYDKNVVEKLQKIKEGLIKAEKEINMRLSILQNSKVKK